MGRINRISTNLKKSNREYKKILHSFKISQKEYYQLEIYRKLKKNFSKDISNRYFADYLEFDGFRVLLGLENKEITNKEIKLYKKILERKGMSKRNIKTKITRIIRFSMFMKSLDHKYLNGGD